MKKQILGLIIITLLLVPFSGCITTSETVEIVQSFDIQATATANCSISGRNISVVLDETDPIITFSITPPSYYGVRKTDSTPIYFSVENYSLIMFKTIGGTPFIRWNHGNKYWYIQGDDRINFLKKYELTLLLDLNPLQEKSDEFTVTFSSGSWEKVYTVRLFDI